MCWYNKLLNCHPSGILQRFVYLKFLDIIEKTWLFFFRLEEQQITKKLLMWVRGNNIVHLLDSTDEWNLL